MALVQADAFATTDWRGAQMAARVAVIFTQAKA
jgi:hypothetical protein